MSPSLKYWIIIVAIISNKSDLPPVHAFLTPKPSTPAANSIVSSSIPTPTETDVLLPHINDSNYHHILNNDANRPVLVDAYVPKCGPCKLIERSILPLISKYSDKIDFVKWNADNQDNNESKEFMEELRKYKMTFRKLPTVILFVDGKPIALRSGMGTASQLDGFLKENLSNYYLESFLEKGGML